MFQRMMVIPQEEYLQLTTVQASKQPMVQQMRNLASQYEKAGDIDDPYRKLVRQAETLDIMKSLKDKIRQQIVTSTPKPYQSRTQSLFQHLEPVLKLSERGEIYNEDDQVIEDSRIEDLVQYAVRDRRRNFIPKGWKDFLTMMHANNIPKYMLNRNTLDELEGRVPAKIKAEVKSPIARGRSHASGLRPKMRKRSSVPRKPSKSPSKQRPKRTKKVPKHLDHLSKY